MSGMTILAGVVTAFSGFGILEFIKFLIVRKDEAKEKAAEKADREERLCTELSDLKMICFRTQLLTLIGCFPEQTGDIMKAAETYFCKMHGNSFMKDIFLTWCTASRTPVPSWFPFEEVKK